MFSQKVVHEKETVFFTLTILRNDHLYCETKYLPLIINIILISSRYKYSTNYFIFIQAVFNNLQDIIPLKCIYLKISEVIHSNIKYFTTKSYYIYILKTEIHLN